MARVTKFELATHHACASFSLNILHFPGIPYHQTNLLMASQVCHNMPDETEDKCVSTQQRVSNLNVCTACPHPGPSQVTDSAPLLNLSSMSSQTGTSSNFWSGLVLFLLDCTSKHLRWVPKKVRPWRLAVNRDDRIYAVHADTILYNFSGDSERQGKLTLSLLYHENNVNKHVFRSTQYTCHMALKFILSYGHHLTV
jgi:hypothetical protein